MVSEIAAKSGVNASRLVLVFLSPRLIDFDSYLPVFMELKAVHPQLDIRFVTFSADNHRNIVSNPTLVDGLDRCGTLHQLGSSGTGGLFARLLRRVRSFLTLTAWVLGRPQPVLVHGRQYCRLPYALFYLLARLRGGVGLVMARIRMVDEGHHLHRRAEFTAAAGQASSWVHRLIGRECDALVHYHDHQEMYLGSYARYGRTDWPCRIKVGLPNALPAWTRMIAEAAEAEREKLRLAGRNVEEVYSFFSAKGYSSTHLRTPESAQRTFVQVIRTLLTLRPGATILLRPHPLALKESWMHEALAEIASPDVVLTAAHPEVMIALSQRAFFNNPTNVMFTTPFGRFVDCSDYRESHYRQVGEKSLAAGYGVIFVNPARDDFAEKMAEALEDGPWAEPALQAERDRLSKANPPSVRVLLEMIISPHSQKKVSE